MHDQLSDEGFRVTTDDKADEKIEDIIELAPDLIILDFLWINDDSGWRLLQILKLDPRTSPIPLLLCTAGVKEAEALLPQLQELDVSVVYKPFNIEQLLNVVYQRLPRIEPV
jgi:two-component system response regulator VicR